MMMCLSSWVLDILSRTLWETALMTTEIQNNDYINCLPLIDEVENLVIMGIRRTFSSWTHAGCEWWLWLQVFFNNSQNNLLQILPGIEVRVTSGWLQGSFLLPFLKTGMLASFQSSGTFYDSMFLGVYADGNTYKGCAAVILLILSCINNFPSSSTHIKDKLLNFQF